ncbi:MAG: cytochrome bc complex cytochrome b subunit, partial [Nitrosopumilus sp.]|nr:cytochrome bc complex cytochrome b subunit [Nitrosopumilus sp.]
YRYAMSQQKNAPPPIPIQDEKPKLAEPDVSVQSGKIPEGDNTTPEEKHTTKELAPEVPIPKTQADLGVGANVNSNVGAGDLNKP